MKRSVGRGSRTRRSYAHVHRPAQARQHARCVHSPAVTDIPPPDRRAARPTRRRLRRPRPAVRTSAAARGRAVPAARAAAVRAAVRRCRASPGRARPRARGTIAPRPTTSSTSGPRSAGRSSRAASTASTSCTNSCAARATTTAAASRCSTRATTFAWEQAQARGVADELRPNFERIAAEHGDPARAGRRSSAIPRSGRCSLSFFGTDRARHRVHPARRRPRRPRLRRGRDRDTSCRRSTAGSAPRSPRPTRAGLKRRHNYVGARRRHDC